MPILIRVAACALAIFFMVNFADGQDTVVAKPASVQTSIKEWVQTKQLISKERADWATEKQVLSDLNVVRKREMTQLGEFIKAAGDRVDELSSQQKKSATEKTDLQSWRVKLESQIAALEKGISPLIPLFPPPLRAKVEEAIIRLETPKADRPLQHRTRDVLLVMQAYLNFQNVITMDADIRTIDGKERSVEILYLGLTQAWFVDKTGKYSGYGVPSKTGWTWSNDPALASTVRNAIDIQTRQASPEFVTFPLLNAAGNTETK